MTTGPLGPLCGLYSSCRPHAASLRTAGPGMETVPRFVLPLVDRGAVNSFRVPRGHRRGLFFSKVLRCGSCAPHGGSIPGCLHPQPLRLRRPDPLILRGRVRDGRYPEVDLRTTTMTLQLPGPLGTLLLHRDRDLLPLASGRTNRTQKTRDGF
jgi:hypothetical protein